MNSDLMKQFIDSLWDNIDYWETEADLSLRERLEGVVFATLCSIDGEGSPYIHFKLVTEDEETGKKAELEWLHDKFYYEKHEQQR